MVAINTAANSAILQSELQAGVLMLTLNRPERRNAIINELARALLPAAVGLPRAKTMLLLEEEFSAAQALAWGLVWAVVPSDDLHATTLRHAHHLAGLDLQVVGCFKRVLNEVGGADLDRAITLESVLQRELIAN